MVTLFVCRDCHSFCSPTGTLRYCHYILPTLFHPLSVLCSVSKPVRSVSPVCLRSVVIVFPSFTSYLALKAQLSYLFLSLNIFSELRCLWLVFELCFKTSSCFVIFINLGTPWGQNFCPFHGNIFGGGFLVYQLLLLFFHHLETCFWVIPLERFCLVSVWWSLLFVQVKYPWTIYF